MGRLPLLRGEAMSWRVLAGLLALLVSAAPVHAAAPAPGAGTNNTNIWPTTDSTTGFQVNKANGTTNILDVDTTNGRVGVGTTSPSALLNTYADGSTEIMISGHPVSSGIDPIGVPGGYGIRLGNGHVALDSATQTALEFFPSYSVGGLDPVAAVYRFKGSSAGTDIIFDDGQVGIGTTAPSTALDVNGTVTATSFSGPGSVPSGAVMAFNLSSCPSGWSALDGTGGYPDARGRTLVGVGTGSGLTARSLQATGGSETVMGAVIVVDSAPGTSTPSQNSVLVPGTAGSKIYSTPPVSANITLGSDATNMQPFLALLYCQKN